MSLKYYNYSRMNFLQQPASLKFITALTAWTIICEDEIITCCCFLREDEELFFYRKQIKRCTLI